MTNQMSEIQGGEVHLLLDFFRHTGHFPALILHYSFGSTNFIPWHIAIGEAFKQRGILNRVLEFDPTQSLDPTILSIINNSECIVASGEKRDSQPLVTAFNVVGQREFNSEYRMSDIGLYLQVHDFA